MKYWLIYNDKGDLTGYSTYKQFDGQECVSELPEKFVIAKQKEKEIDEASNLLDSTLNDIIEYFCDVSNDEMPHLSKEEFKQLCLARKNARIKLKI